MTLHSLGGKFEACARELLKTAIGEDAPSTYPTALVENMIQSIVAPQASMSVDFTYSALGAALFLSHDKGKDLSRDEMETVIRKHFELK